MIAKGVKKGGLCALEELQNFALSVISKYENIGFDRYIDT